MEIQAYVRQNSEIEFEFVSNESNSWSSMSSIRFSPKDHHHFYWSLLLGSYSNEILIESKETN